LAVKAWNFKSNLSSSPLFSRAAREEEIEQRDVDEAKYIDSRF